MTPKNDFCNSSFFKACFVIITFGMIINVIKNGYYFGIWLHQISN